MKILIGVQARTASKRFPGKVLEKIDDKTVLEHVVASCKDVKILGKVNEYIVSVIGPEGDIKLQEECKRIGVDCVLFDNENDLISRYVRAAEKYQADAVVRVTADCVFLPTEMIEECIKCLTESDYCSNVIIRSFVEGWDCQGASRRCLDWVNLTQTAEREHPFKALDENQTVRDEFVKLGFTFKSIVNPQNIIFQKTSIDAQIDLDNARKIYEARQNATK